MVDNWCKCNDMILNKKKCGIIKVLNRVKKFKVSEDNKIIVAPPSEFILDLPLV